MKRLLLILLLAGFASSTLHATVTLYLDAGYLYSGNSASSYLPTNSLVLLISNTGESSFQAASLNHYVTGDDSIVDAFPMAYNAGNSTVPEVEATITGTFGVTLPGGGDLAQGDELALRWFPNITYTQYTQGILPAANNAYGTYTSGTNAYDGGDEWVAPANGDDSDLVFNTDAAGGTQSENDGYASSIIAVPEPASFPLVAGALALGALILRKRR
jgi:hypothetical protein